MDGEIKPMLLLNIVWSFISYSWLKVTCWFAHVHACIHVHVVNMKLFCVIHFKCFNLSFSFLHTTHCFSFFYRSITKSLYDNTCFTLKFIYQFTHFSCAYIHVHVLLFPHRLSLFTWRTFASKDSDAHNLGRMVSSSCPALKLWWFHWHQIHDSW